MTPSQTHLSIATTRRVNALYFRLKLNAFITKFCKNVRCLCGEHISNTHIIFECSIVKPFLPTFCEQSVETVFKNPKLPLLNVYCTTH